MTAYCHYHPVSPAKWRCRDCQRHFCKTCLPGENEKTRRCQCPRCHHSLQFLGAANTAIPFWERLPAFFQYPLAKDPLALVAICTVAPLLFSSQLLIFIVSLTLLCVMTKYLYSILDSTAEGHMTPPTLVSAFDSEGLSALFLQIGVFLIFGLIILGASQAGGQLLGWLTTAFVLLVLPASVMSLARERTIASAINPLQLTLLISTLGWPYFILYAHLLLLFLSMGVAVDFLIEHSSPMFAGIGAGFINGYFTMIAFNMLGYVLFQYQEKLGYATTDHQNDDDSNVLANRAGRIDADIDLYLKEGEYQQVKQLVAGELKKKKGDPWRMEQLYRICDAQGDIATLKPFIAQLLDTLLIRNQPEQAISLLKKIYLDDEEFALKDADVSFKMAQFAYHQHEYKLIIRLLKDFHSRFPDASNITDAYILLARTLANGLRLKDKAQVYLRFLIQQFPEYSGIDALREMEQTIARGGRI